MVSITGMTVTDEGTHRVGKVPANTTGRISVGDNETFEGFLIDQTAPNSRAKITANGSNWTIRNVGFKGKDDVDDPTGIKLIGMVAHGECLVENVYGGDGAVYYNGAGGSSGLMWLSPESTGNLTVRGVWAEDWKDNGMYLSSRHNGRVIIEDSVAINNYHANFRLGQVGPSARSVVRNSFSAFSDFGGLGRGVWGWGDSFVEVDECVIPAPGEYAFWAGSKTSTGTEIHVSNTEWSGGVAETYGDVSYGAGNTKNPDPNWIPTGVVTSAENAAKGITYTPTDGEEPPPPTEDGGTGNLDRVVLVALGAAIANRLFQ